MSDNTYVIGGRRISIRDLGEKLNQEFKNLYSAYFSGGTLDYKKFHKASHQYFDKYNDYKKHFNEHNHFFENFTPLWTDFLNMGNINHAKDIWIFALRNAWDWERRRKLFLHKGTPYYFLGGTCIIWKKYDEGFLLIHQALEEDKKAGLKDTPAECFVTLDFSINQQYFLNIILEKTKFLDSSLKKYSGNLDLNAFRAKFLKDDSVREIVFSFVYNLFKVHDIIVAIDEKLKRNDFVSQLEADIIFDLCKVNDNFIRSKNSSEWKFAKQIIFLSNKTTLSFNLNKIRELGKEFDKNFESTLTSILNSNFKFKDNSRLNGIEKSLAIVYGFRNFGAHKIENQPVIYNNFNGIIKHILNSLFFSVEKL